MSVPRKLLRQTSYWTEKQVVKVAPISNFSVGFLEMNKKSSVCKLCQQPHYGVCELWPSDQTYEINTEMF